MGVDQMCKIHSVTIPPDNSEHATAASSEQRGSEAEQRDDSGSQDGDEEQAESERGGWAHGTTRLPSGTQRNRTGDTEYLATVYSTQDHHLARRNSELLGSGPTSQRQGQ